MGAPVLSSRVPGASTVGDVGWWDHVSYHHPTVHWLWSTGKASFLPKSSSWCLKEPQSSMLWATLLQEECSSLRIVAHVGTCVARTWQNILHRGFLPKQMAQHRAQDQGRLKYVGTSPAGCHNKPSTFSRASKRSGAGDTHTVSPRRHFTMVFAAFGSEAQDLPCATSLNNSELGCAI